MGKLTLFIIVSMVLVLGIFSSTAFIVFAEPTKVTSETKCTSIVNEKTGKQIMECCRTETDEFGQVTKLPCHITCWNKQGNEMICSKSLIGGTLDPGITGGAGAGVLKGEDEDDSKDTNIGNNAGVLQDGGTTNNSNNTTPTQKQNFGKGGSPLIDKNIIGDGGAGVSPYIGDSSTWCKDVDGKMVCTCKGGTDCLHCGVYTGMPCTDTSKIPAVIK